MTLLSEASFLVTPNGYKASKLYAAIPTNGDGDMTFTRATTATRVDENDLVSSVASNVPRIDYTGGGCPSILLEPQRTNLFINSNNFVSSNWFRLNLTVTVNQAISPTGENNASLLTATEDNGILAEFNEWTTVQRTVSFFAKKNTSSVVEINNSSSPSNFVFYDLENGVILSEGGTMTGQIEDFGNGWYRIIATYFVTGGTATFGFRIPTAGSVYVYGAQIEEGSYPTSYTQTGASTVTRNADVLSRDNIYTNNLIVGGGGTWFVHLINNTAFTSDANGNLFLDTASGGITNGINIRSIGTIARLYINFYTSGFITFQYLTTTDTVKLAIKWNGATADVFENGAKVVSATTFTPTAMEHLGGNGSDQPKYIKQMALFAKPLTEAQCIALTTL
jgi:hypothetical protein